MIKKVKNLIYHLDISHTMHIHLVIFIIYLKLCLNSEKNLYKCPQSINSLSVMIKSGDWQLYKVEKILNRREHQYSRDKQLIEYLIY